MVLIQNYNEVKQYKKNNYFNIVLNNFVVFDFMY